MKSSHPTTGLAKHAWWEIDRVEPPIRPVADRVTDFRETIAIYDEETAREQARRCIQCPNPACVEACPLDSAIPDLLALIADGQFKEAAEIYFYTHHIPEIASHVCVGGQACERACILSGKSYAIPIRALSRFLLDYGWKHGLAEPPVAAPKNKTVAVLGSGIGGMIAADALSRIGYKVTVFDTRQKPGGRMMNGMPGFRMDLNLVERRIEQLKRRGISFHMGVTFGQDVKLSDLRREFDAVYLGFGTTGPVPLNIPGAEMKGVFQAVNFVSNNSMAAASQEQPDSNARPLVPASVKGKRVVVLGGGDTASDVLRIAIRRGAADAVCIYRRDEASMPADAEELVLAREEGARFQFFAQPVAIIGNENGEVTHVRCVPTELTEPDALGRPGCQPVAGAVEFDIPADLVFVAYGFIAPKPPDNEDFALLQKDEQDHLRLDKNLMTNLPGVFAGGSVARGPVPLFQAVRDAHTATDAIDRYLTPA